MQWPLRAGGAVDIDPMAIADNAELLHIAAEQGRGIFLGPVNPACTRGRRRSYRSSMI